MTPPLILIAEDEPAIRDGLCDALESEGYRVVSAANGPDAVKAFREHAPDLLLLDIMMPGRNGYEVCRDIRRENRRLPILMLTAKGEEIDKVLGLELGADDYLTKPFGLRELLARVRSLLRRRERDAAVPDTLAIGAATVDFARRQLTRDGTTHALSEKETGMLRLLATAHGAPVPRETFLDVIWGYHAYPSTRTVDNFIAALRTKLEPDPANPRHLLTIRSTGYRLEI